MDSRRRQTLRFAFATALLAANLGAAVAYILMSPHFPANMASPIFWSLGAMFAATKVAARLVQSDPTAEGFTTVFGINVMAPLRLASLVCLIAGFAAAAIDTTPGDPVLITPE